LNLSEDRIMKKWAVVLLWVMGLLLVVHSMYSYFTSGEMVLSVPLSVGKTSNGHVDLTESMNPLRILLETQYVSRTKNERVNFYKYNVSLSDTENSQSWSHEGNFSLNRKRKEIKANEKTVTKQRLHSLGVMNVNQDATFNWHVNFIEKQATIKNAKLVIRRNVETQLPFNFWLGITFGVVGLIAVFTGRK
jgi:hypothetical protein